MTERDRARERDLVLAPNEYAFISDETKGNINAYVGPHKTSLANTDQPVVFNPATKRFERVTLEEAIHSFAVAPVGWYVLLKNPARDGTHPKTGSINNLAELEVGRKRNLAGPVSFALWPGQMVRIIQGHHLRSNQYLVVHVYDEEAARANWASAVIKPQTTGSSDATTETTTGGELVVRLEAPDLSIGKLLVIRGTDVSFYIPPTGVEVVPDAGEVYVREAVTLERLEYCILLDEDGEKTFLRGPAVVFPRPTQTFVERDGARKFRAIELNETSGIYVKVIAPYVESDGTPRKVGEELFITGREQMIYFPRPEHAAVRYGNQAMHNAVAIPAGEARYVLDRQGGNIRLERGPKIFLPDPRREVIVRRILDRRQVEQWFPGNVEAIRYNERLAALRENDAKDFVAEKDARAAGAPSATPDIPAPTRARAPTASSSSFGGDDFNRRQNFAQPRSIVLDTRYDGAVSIAPRTGYAVQVVSKTGDRKVIVGPTTYLLAYDEVLQAMDLSTGTPKTDDKVHTTVYLRVLYNKVSDVVEAETADLVSIRIRLSYRVNFEGDPNAWFNVENYVKFLTEHLRSLVRAAVKHYRVQDLHPRAVPIIRDVVLGAQGENGKRPGRLFTENGMRIYDVEVLDVEIGDAAIEQLLVQAQHAAVQQTLTIGGERRRLELVREKEAIDLEIQQIEASTGQSRADVEKGIIAQKRELELARIASETACATERLAAKRAEQEALDAVNAAELGRRRAQKNLELEAAEKDLTLRLRAVEAEVGAVAEKAKAVSPDLIAALQAFGDRALAERMAESMAPLAILGGESVSDVLARLLKGTKLAKVLAETSAESGNGASRPVPPKTD
jgi:major vault protein